MEPIARHIHCGVAFRETNEAQMDGQALDEDHQALDAGKLLMTTFNTNTRDQIAGWSCNEDIDILVESAVESPRLFRDMMPMD